MKKLILFATVLATLYYPGRSYAELVYAPNYDCEDLQRLVEAKGQLDIQMIVGYATYIHSPRACRAAGGIVGKGRVYFTRDAVVCRVGYVCNYSSFGGGNGSG